MDGWNEQTVYFLNSCNNDKTVIPLGIHFILLADLFSNA